MGGCCGLVRSDLFAGQVDMDDNGFLKVVDGAMTSVEGVFSAGDVHDTEWKQAITAAGSGCMAAISVERYLTTNDLLIEMRQEVRTKNAERSARTNHLPAGTSGWGRVLSLIPRGRGVCMRYCLLCQTRRFLREAQRSVVGSAPPVAAEPRGTQLRAGAQ